jgi:hypothetical protein
VFTERTESWRGQEYRVRTLSARSDPKTYRCPGCDQTVTSAQPHVVVWPTEDPDASDRRHWHTPCWVARNTRSPNVHRGRSAPRY